MPLRPHLHEYVFIENDIISNENAMIVLHLHVVFVSFSVVCTKTMKTIESSKNQSVAWYACEAVLRKETWWAQWKEDRDESTLNM